LLRPTEDVLKSWNSKKGLLIKSRPTQSKFSFSVCLAIVLSIAFGFLGGFITAGLAINDNFSSVYAGLIAEIENRRNCLERQDQNLPLGNIDLKQANFTDTNLKKAQRPSPSWFGRQAHEQAILSIFKERIESLQKE